MITGNYDSKIEEKKWQDFWQDNNIYKFDNTCAKDNKPLSKCSSDSDVFSIDTPPPTVSGLLHMGHVFSYTQADFIARYQRMKGKNVFYPIGFDDNGLPTERLVEKVKNIRANNMPRQEFIDICTEVVKEAEEEFRALFKSIALSVDWDLEYQTISKNSRAISQMSFLDLFDKDRVYRKIQPTLWDVVDQTALAQADIVDLELSSTMNEVAFKAEGEEIIISTSRPELIPACIAVFYHPNDERYKKLAGKSAITALFGIKVPILPEETVDMEKGTGLVMCCSFGDAKDVEWWQKHQLPLRIIINKNGRLYNLEQLGQTSDWESVDPQKAKTYVEQISGLKVKEARAKILELLQDAALLKSQHEIKHVVKCAERSGAPLEILVSPQWFVKILDLKEKLLQRSSECNFHPSYMKIRLDNWINGLSWDWCISRQRFFGVPFPAWYSKRLGEEGKILLAHKDDLPVDPMVDLPRGYNRDEVEPDFDVMDTWATSSISPQLNSLAINDNYSIDLDRHKKIFPMDLRPQAHEIIRTWAFYTIVKAELHQETIPWKDLMISGWCLAADKTKMSKSKGNVVTPNALITEKGADVVRYWASTSRLGADTAYSEDLLKIGKKLVNKLWNAAKFADIHFSKLNNKPDNLLNLIKTGVIKNQLDLWLLSKLYKTIEKATIEFEKFEYCNARAAIEEFFWNDFCDNYLELVKVRIYDEHNQDEAGRLSAANTLYHCFDSILRLFAPILPHITEEIYQNIISTLSIHRKFNWPILEDYHYDKNSEELGAGAIEILDIVRKFKAERNLSLKAGIGKIQINTKVNISDDILSDIQNASNAQEIILDNSDAPTASANSKYHVHIS